MLPSECSKGPWSTGGWSRRPFLRCHAPAVRLLARSVALPLALLLALLAAPGMVAAQQPDSALPARIDRVFAVFDSTTPGCGVGVSRNGQPLYIHAYGMANLEYGVPNTDSTVFESGSIAKQFTASDLVLLAQDGKLSLDDDIRTYLPEVPDFGGQRITIRNLLTHTSGLRDQWGLLGIEGRGPGTQVHTLATTLDLVAHQRMLNFPPGSAYVYSNTGYALAAIIIQRVSGQSLQAFTQERLFRPLGMTHTRWRDDYTEIVKNRATAYRGSRAAGFHQDMPFTDMVGNGGVLSTMADLLRWNANLDAPRVGGAAYVQALETPMRLTNGRTLSYALGLAVGPYEGVPEVSHSGSTAGYRSFMARYPDQHVAVAVWCNDAGANPTALARQVADLVLVKPARTATQAGAPKQRPPAAELARWAGVYRDARTDRALALAASDSVHLPRGAVSFRGARPHREIVVVAPDDDTLRLEEVAPPPPVIPLHDYTGTYASDELDVLFAVAIRDGRLVLRRRPADELELRPVYADDFTTRSELGSVRFARDERGRVTGFSFFAGRVLDVRFRKIAN